MTPLRILLIGDYSNMHSQLAATLRSMGHKVTVMSEGCGFQNTERNIDVSRRQGKLGGAILAARCKWPLHRHMRGYDIVALQNPHFLKLRPARLRYFFDRLRGENRAVFLTAAGADSLYVHEMLNANSPLRYNEYRIGDSPAPLAIANRSALDEWLSPELTDFCRYVYDNVDGAVTALYEYHTVCRRYMSEDRFAYGGIPIDTSALAPFPPAAPDDGVRIFLGRHAERQAEKGTDLLEKASRIVMERHPGKCSLEIVENRPYREYIGLMAHSHLVLDQIYSYTPATNALIAMARGRAVVSGAEPEFYDFIGERANHPIFNAPTSLDPLVELLDSAVLNPDDLMRRGADGREFVKRHNDARIVANRFLTFWTSKLK